MEVRIDKNYALQLEQCKGRFIFLWPFADF